MIELLAALSASAATGIRIAVPLLLIGLMQGDQLWSHVPVFSNFPPSLVLGVLVSWALTELMLSKDRMGMRIVQVVQMVLSPFFGAIAGMTVADIAEFNPQLLWLIGIISGLLALVLQVVQTGWFYRLRDLPLWAVFLQDFLCVALLLMAFDAPQQGGLIALMLMWLALRSAVSWRQWSRAVPSKLHTLSRLDRPSQKRLPLSYSDQLPAKTDAGGRSRYPSAYSSEDETRADSPATDSYRIDPRTRE